jgi:hypothetical protein
VTLRKEAADFSSLSKLAVKIYFGVEFLDTMAHGALTLNITIEFPTHLEQQQSVHEVEPFTAYST